MPCKPYFVCCLLVLGLAGCADASKLSGPAAAPGAPSPEEEMANKQPLEMCYDQCMRSSGSSGTKADRDFCRQRCTF